MRLLLGTHVLLWALADPDRLRVEARDALRDGRDPFDRMLVAQALAESLTLVMRDQRFALYGVEVLSA